MGRWIASVVALRLSRCKICAMECHDFLTLNILGQVYDHHRHVDFVQMTFLLLLWFHNSVWNVQNMFYIFWSYAKAQNMKYEKLYKDYIIKLTFHLILLLHLQHLLDLRILQMQNQVGFLLPIRFSTDHIYWMHFQFRVCWHYYPDCQHKLYKINPIHGIVTSFVCRYNEIHNFMYELLHISIIKIYARYNRIFFKIHREIKKT